MGNCGCGENANDSNREVTVANKDDQDDIDKIDLNDKDLNNAALKIQSHYRGKKGGKN